MESTLPMLLAGGAGSRLLILSRDRAKPAVPFAGIYRIIDFTLTNIIDSGMNHVGILTQYRPSSLMDHIGVGSPWGFLGRKHSAKILPPYTGESTSDWYRGTADAILQNVNYINRFSPERILILSSDHIYRMDYSKLINYHKDNKAHLTIAVMPVPKKEASRFGIMETNSSNRITGFEEKPQHPKGNMASLGIYVFNTGVLLKRLIEDANKKESAHDFGKNIITSMIKRDRVYAFPFNGYWKDVGTLASYRDAHKDILDPSSGLDLFEWKTRTNPDDRGAGDMKSSYISKDACVEDSLIAKGCLIKGEVVRSVLSPGTVVETGARVVDSILFHNTVIGRNAYVNEIICDKDCRIGRDTAIGKGNAATPNETYPHLMDSGITLIGKKTNIPRGYSIGRNCLIYPNKSNRMFPPHCIGQGKTFF